MEPNAVGTGTPAPTTQSPPPPAPPPAAPNPSSGTGGVGVTPAAGSPTPQPVPTQTPVTQPGQQQTPAISPDIQAQLDRYRAMEGEYQQLQQYRHLIPLGYRAYQQAGQPTPAGQPAAQPQAEAHPWGLPQFDQRLLDFVARDPQTGRLTVLPGGPPDAAIRVEEYQAKLREVQTEFYTNPMKLLGPMIEKKAQEIAQKQFQENFGAVQQQQQTQQIIQQNRDWLYAKDAQGQPVTQFNPATGRNQEVLSPYGQQYVQFVRQAEQYGVRDPEAQHSFAVQGLQNLLLQQRFAQGQQTQAGQQTATQYVQQAAQQTTAQQLVNNNPNAVPAEPQVLSLRDRMRQSMDGNGITDAALAQQLSRAG